MSECSEALVERAGQPCSGLCWYTPQTHTGITWTHKSMGIKQTYDSGGLKWHNLIDALNPGCSSNTLCSEAHPTPRHNDICMHCYGMYLSGYAHGDHTLEMLDQRCTDPFSPTAEVAKVSFEQKQVSHCASTLQNSRQTYASSHPGLQCGARPWVWRPGVLEWGRLSSRATPH